MRVFKSRSQATDACTAGRVEVNETVAKPATRIRPADVVTVRRRDHVVVHEVVETIDKRVSASRAAECLVDRSPERPPRVGRPPAVFGRRDAGAGRPTKRERREIDRLRGRDQP